LEAAKGNGEGGFGDTRWSRGFFFMGVSVEDGDGFGEFCKLAPFNFAYVSVGCAAVDRKPVEGFGYKGTVWAIHV
jgi:hypothetical protein